MLIFVWAILRYSMLHGCSITFKYTAINPFQSQWSIKDRFYYRQCAFDKAIQQTILLNLIYYDCFDANDNLLYYLHSLHLCLNRSWRFDWQLRVLSDQLLINTPDCWFPLVAVHTILVQCWCLFNIVLILAFIDRWIDWVFSIKESWIL